MTRVFATSLSAGFFTRITGRRARLLLCLTACWLLLGSARASSAEDKTQPQLRLLYAGPSKVVIGEGASFSAELSAVNYSSSERSPATSLKAEVLGLELVGESVFAVGELAPASGVGPFRFHVKASKNEERGALKISIGDASSSVLEIRFEIAKLKPPPFAISNPALVSTCKFDSLNGNSDWLLQGASSLIVKNGNSRGVEVEIDRTAEFLFGANVGEPKRFMICCESDGGVTAVITLEKDGGEKMSVVFKPPQELATFSIPAPSTGKGGCVLRSLRLDGAGKFSLYSFATLSGKPFDPRVVLKGQRFYRGRDLGRDGVAVELGSPMQVEIADNTTADLMVTLTPATKDKMRPAKNKPLSGIGKSGMQVVVENPECVGLYELKVESAALRAPYIGKLLIAASEQDVTRYFQLKKGAQTASDGPQIRPPPIAKAKPAVEVVKTEPLPAKPEPHQPPAKAEMPKKETTESQPVVNSSLPSPAEFIFYFPTPKGVAADLKPELTPFVLFGSPVFSSLDRDDLDPNLPDFVAMNDCLEGLNRTVFGFNIGLMKWVFRPVGTVYASMFPRCAANAISSASKNMEWPARVFACLLQGKFEGAGEDSLRFLINTSVGVAGLFDPAGEWLGLKMQDEDFGQAFAVWGFGPGCYLVLPMQGPMSLRDAVGLIFDSALDPKTYIPYGGSWLFRINSGALNYEDFRLLVDANKDPYVIAKQLWIIARQLKIAD